MVVEAGVGAVEVAAMAEGEGNSNWIAWPQF
jgi:hypothetical protein